MITYNIYCDFSSKGNKHQGAYIIKRYKKTFLYKSFLSDIDENNKGELTCVIKSLEELINLNIYNSKIIIHNDNQVVIDKLDDFFTYIKVFRFRRDLYHHYLMQNLHKEKTYKYFRFVKACNYLNRYGINDILLSKTLMHLMENNKIIFKWIPRSLNIEADTLSKETTK